MSDSSSHPDVDHKKVTEILHRTRMTLRRTELALEDLENAIDGERRVAAMCNVVVTGRAVTNVLQNLRSAVSDFDIWYKPWELEMRQDPLLKYLYNLRSEILKKGKEGTAVNLSIVSLTIPDDLLPAPQNAVRTFIGDQNGGIGWDVELEDGTIQKIYAKLPEDKVRTWLSFQNLPQVHLGKPISDDSLENVCRLYTQYLQRIVADAETRFAAV